MTEVDQEKMIKLAEGIEYENEESYTEKLQIIKDKYFRAEDAEEKQVLTEEDTQDDMEPNEDNSSDTAMAEAPESIRQYAQAISSTNIN